MYYCWVEMILSGWLFFLKNFMVCWKGLLMVVMLLVFCSFFMIVLWVLKMVLFVMFFVY